MAVAGGSNLILEQSPAISLSMLGYLSASCCIRSDRLRHPGSSLRMVVASLMMSGRMGLAAARESAV